MNHALDLPDHLLAALLATMGEEVAVADLVGVPQYQLGAKVDIRQRKLLEERVGEEEVEVRARLQSLTLPHAGDWLHAAPILALGLHMQPQEFFLAVAYRLGLPHYRVEGLDPTRLLGHLPCRGHCPPAGWYLKGARTPPALPATSQPIGMASM